MTKSIAVFAALRIVSFHQHAMGQGETGAIIHPGDLNGARFKILFPDL